MESQEPCEASTSMAMATETTTAMPCVGLPRNILSDIRIESDEAINASESVPLTHASRFTCRICSEGESKETLMIICNCRAPDGFVHVSCLEKRLLDEDIAHCKNCNYIFEVERTVVPILQWSRNREERHNLIFLIVFALGYNIICPVVMFIHYTSFGYSPSLDSVMIATDVAVSFFMHIGYCCGIYFLIKRIRRSWHNLRESNRGVKLIIQLKGEPHGEATADNDHDGDPAYERETVL